MKKQLLEILQDNPVSEWAQGALVNAMLLYAYMKTLKKHG
jgi:hypothetical protein